MPSESVWLFLLHKATSARERVNIYRFFVRSFMVLGPCVLAAYGKYIKGTFLEQRFVWRVILWIFMANLANLREASVA